MFTPHTTHHTPHGTPAAAASHLDVVSDLLEHVVEIEDAASGLSLAAAAAAKPAARLPLPLLPLLLPLLLLRLREDGDEFGLERLGERLLASPGLSNARRFLVKALVRRDDDVYVFELEIDWLSLCTCKARELKSRARANSAVLI